jgi:hypothetical protein
MILIPEVHNALACAVIGGRRPPVWRRWPHRVPILATGVVIVTGTAIAATTGSLPWRPDLGSSRPAASSVVPALRAALGILRRPQTAADRGPLVLTALRHLDRRLVNGVHTDAIRVVLQTRREVAVLVPVERAGPSDHRAAMQDALCLLSASYARPYTWTITQHGRPHKIRFRAGYTGWSESCGDLSTLRTTGIATGTSPNPNSPPITTARPTHFTLRRVVLVPDGVARVTVRLPDSQPLVVTVRDNVYQYITHTFPGYARANAWYDAAGRLIGNR